MGKFCLGVAGVAGLFAAACGAGLPPEEPGAAQSTPPPQGCETTGTALSFLVDSSRLPAVLFWAADGRIDPTDPTTDQNEIKFRIDVPADQLPTGVSNATIRIGPVRSTFLPAGGHFDTAFQIVATDPADMAGFTGAGQIPLTLAIRYDPVKCEIPPEVESNLVLGRLNASGVWQEVCPDTATPGRAVPQVSCSEGDLSFGVFGVIQRPGGALNDPDPPVFPPNSISLTVRERCNSCAPPSITLEWGPATDGAGSGILGYWIYVDGTQVAFTNNAPNPLVRYTLQTSGAVDTTLPHLYQVQAVDNAGNRSALFGALRV